MNTARDMAPIGAHLWAIKWACEDGLKALHSDAIIETALRTIENEIGTIRQLIQESQS